MRTILAITRKELEQYFASPIAYVVTALFLVLSGVFFYIYLQFYIQNAAMASQMGGEGMDITQSVMRPFFGNISFFFLIILPLLTMRLFAEEKKQGTYELLMTSPISITQMVVGKFLGSLALTVLILLLLGIYPLLILAFGGHPDAGPILTGFLGLLLVAGAFLGFGLFASAVTKSQIVAAVLGFVFFIVFWIINYLTRSEEWYGKLLQYISIYQRFDDFTKGVLNLNDVFYYISFAFFGLFLTGIVLQSQRWRS
jgi:ABC-2 type transport system permease protein